jgi:hypothetical protein
MSFEDVIADFPLEHINSKAPHTPYPFWHFVEHIRIAQWDVLEFIGNPYHVSPSHIQRPEYVLSPARVEFGNLCNILKAEIDAPLRFFLRCRSGIPTRLRSRMCAACTFAASCA